MNIEDILKQYTNDDGNIEASKVADVVKAINNAVGKEFVDKKRYNEKLTEIDTLKAEKQTAEDNATNAEKWKTKYDALKGDFDSYKDDIAKKEKHAVKETAFKDLLKNVGISDKRIDAVVKVSGGQIDGLEIGDDGKIKDVDKLTESIKNEWSDFIVSTTPQGAQTPTPPASTGGKVDLDKLSMAEYIAARKKG